MQLVFELILDKSRELDLLQLIPEKFHSSQLLVDLVNILSQEVGSWLEKIRDLRLLQDPDTAGFTYLQHLSKLPGVDFPEVYDESYEDQLRKEVRDAVDWIRSKGTYRALHIVAYLMGVNANIRDLYTNDYTNFVAIDDWFVGEENENPNGLDSSYYKSPHFGFSILLNNFHAWEGDSAQPEYLWTSGSFTRIHKYVDRIRPVNTVPHYELLLDLPLDEKGLYIEWPTGYEQSITGIDLGGPAVPIEGGSVVRRMMDLQAYPILRFDEMDEVGGRSAQFDEEEGGGEATWKFDKEYASVLLMITGWKLGDGHDAFVTTEDSSWEQRSKWLTPQLYDITPGIFSLESIVLEKERDGDVIYEAGPPPKYTWRDSLGNDIMYCYLYENYWEFQIIIPQEVDLKGISEGALYIGDEPFIAWLNPDIDKEGSGQIDWYTFPGVGMTIRIRWYIGD